MKSLAIAAPPILLKAKRAALWLWLGFVACVILASGFRQVGWEVTAIIFSGGIWVFAIAFGACIAFTVIVICATLFRSITVGRRNV